MTDCCSCGFPIEEGAICDRRLLIFVDFRVHFKVECFDGAHFGEGFEHIFFLNSSIELVLLQHSMSCLLYTSPSPRDLSTSRMPSSA